MLEIPGLKTFPVLTEIKSNEEREGKKMQEQCRERSATLSYCKHRYDGRPEKGLLTQSHGVKDGSF